MKFPMTIEAKLLDKQPMALHSHLADGTSPSGKPFSIDRDEPTHSTFWINYDGKCYAVGIRDIMDGLFDSIDKHEDPRGERKSDMWPPVPAPEAAS